MIKLTLLRYCWFSFNLDSMALGTRLVFLRLSHVNSSFRNSINSFRGNKINNNEHFLTFSVLTNCTYMQPSFYHFASYIHINI